MVCKKLKKLDKVCVFGYSGHSYVIIDSLLKLGYEIKGYFNKTELEFNPFELAYLGFETDADFIVKVGSDFVFPAVGDNYTRVKLIDLFEKHELKQLVLIDPSAIVSQQATIGLNTFVAPGAVINSLATIGKGVIVNSNSIIEHNVTIEDYCHTAPGSVLCGGVTIGRLSFVGANAVVKEYCNIGNGCIIGAGATVLANVPNSEKWVGTPARKI